MGNFADNPALSVEQLTEQLNSLSTKVENLSARLATLEGSIPARQKAAGSQFSPPDRVQVQDRAGAQAGPAPLIDTSALLTRVATVCFLLVVALILRTITDNQIINTQVGSVLGMAYAAFLIIAGWRLYSKKSRLAPVFPGCGILLLFSIVLETHARFQSLSTIGAYSILFIAGVTLFALSIRHRATVLICLGVPGTAAVAMAIDFPYPIYPVLGLLLLSAIVAASYAFKQQMCRYLRWFTLVLAALFWLLWTSKMNTLPTCAEPVAAAMYPSWFFPILFAFWGVYLATVVLNVLKKDLQLGFFESIIPTVTAVGAFAAGNLAVCNWFERANWFYLAVLIIAVLHLGLAWWLARHDREKASGSNVFILAGACLIIMLSAAVFKKNIGYVLPIWSGSAFILALLSAYLHNQGIRVTSYLMQTVTCTAAIISGTVAVPAASPAATALATAGLCVFGLLQYQWSRKNHPDPTHSFFFAKLDRNDLSAVILLVSGLLGGYYFAQFLLHQALGSMIADFDFQYRSGQSLIINIAAILLMAIALKGKNRELIIIATILALIGAGKVFIFDMLRIKGVPLVLSVFSTGVVALFGSVVLGRWQKKEVEAA